VEMLAAVVADPSPDVLPLEKVEDDSADVRGGLYCDRTTIDRVGDKLAVPRPDEEREGQDAEHRLKCDAVCNQSVLCKKVKQIKNLMVKEF
jgi:hypothetical protein